MNLIQSTPTPPKRGIKTTKLHRNKIQLIIINDWETTASEAVVFSSAAGASRTGQGGAMVALPAVEPVLQSLDIVL
jgi:hypothetical protein